MQKSNIRYYSPCRLQVNEPPFHNVGVDYFEPFLIKQKRCLVKRYGCLFSCLCMRTLHIEIANFLTAGSFINALHRFIGGRGNPDHIDCDNGSNFIGANRILRESLDELNQESLNQFCCQQKVKLTFNPPTASHMGGAWERMIRLVSKFLTALTRDETLDDEAFSTFMAELEGILNSRPRVPIMFDDSIQNEPLAPNHLLPGPQRENFTGGTKVDTGPPNLIGSPKPYWGHAVKSFFVQRVQIFI